MTTRYSPASMMPLLLGVLAAVTWATCPAGTLELARRGAAPTYRIALPRNASVAERHAAAELQSWTERLTGVRLPIVETTSRTKAIWINRDRPSENLGEDGFSLTAEGEDVCISGCDRGIHYGVYELLETYGGIGWFDIGFTDVPESDVLRVPDDLAVTENPAFLRRCHDWRRISRNDDFAVRSRINDFTRPEAFGGNFPGFDDDLSWCHTFHKIVPVEKYFETHPEYFSFFDGKRQKVRTQLCMTNPDVFRIVKERVLARVRYNLEKKTGVKYYGVSQDDWNGYCTCPNCAAIDAREESHSGALFDFINRLAAEVEKVDPDAIVETLAYMFSRRPPKTIRLRHNVMPLLCSIECDFSKGIGGSRYKENVDFRSDLERWQKISNHLMIWDYTANWRAAPCPQHNLTTLRENARYYRDHGVDQVFFEGWSDDAPTVELAALKGWLCGKMLWNPDRPLRPLIERFVRAYYGKGASYVMQYIDLLERQPIDESKTPFTYDTVVGNMPWTEEFLKAGQSLWHQAEAAVTGSSPQIVSNVAWGAFGIDYTRLANVLHRSGKWKAVQLSRTPARKLERAEYDDLQLVARRLLATMDANPKAVISSSLNNERFKGAVRAMANGSYSEGKTNDRALIQDWLFEYVNWPISTTIFREADPDATDGRVVRMEKAGPGWQLWFDDMSQIEFDVAASYRLKARTKTHVPEGVTPELPVARIALFDKTTERVVLESTVFASEDYEWTDLGKFVAENHSYVFRIEAKDSRLLFDCLEVTREEVAK